MNWPAMPPKKMKSAPLFTLLMVTVSPCYAQDSGYYWTAPLSMSAGRDSQRLKDSGNQTLTGAVSLFSAGLSLLRLTPRTEFSLAYEPEFEQFDNSEASGAWNHDARFQVNYRGGRRFTLRAGTHFLSTADPTRHLAESFILLPRGRFKQNSLHADLAYRLNSRTDVGFRFDNTATIFASDESFDTGISNQMTTAGTVAISRLLAARHRLVGSYSFLKLSPLNGDGEVSEASSFSFRPAGSLSAAYGYVVNRDISFHLSGGIVHGPALSYTFGGRLESRLGFLQLTAGYERYLSFLGGLTSNGAGFTARVRPVEGLLPSSLLDSIAVSLRGKLNNRVGIEIRARASETHSKFVEPDIKSLFGRVRVDYQATDRLLFFSTLDLFHQNSSELAVASAPRARTRYFGGIEVVLSSSPPPVTLSHLAEKEVLPPLRGRATGRTNRGW